MTLARPRPLSGVARYVKDPFPGISHGVGAILGIAGLIALLLLVRDNSAAIVGVSIYGASLIILYSASFCAHAIHSSVRGDDWLDRIDHAAIFFLIAGTYTPICLTTLHGAWGICFLSVEWAIALIGAAAVLIVGPRKVWVLLYLPMGWLVIVAVGPLVARMATPPLVLLAIGGMIYSLGAIVFVTKRPRLWPGYYDSHDLWHTMVLIASACHFATVLSITAG